MKASARALVLLLSGAAAVAAFLILRHDPAAPEPASIRFVGSQACASCHPQETQRWSGSHHDRAMQVADSLTVLGDFDDARFDYFGLTSTFSRRGSKFSVRTEGPDAALHDYEVAYTLGIAPLQQYLIPFPGGRYQALSLCWDSRPRREGGQRWFHLHPGEKIGHDDVLHWTGPLQNWNFMCAECHTTEPQKNYDPERDRYETTFSEPHVGCEACHGPGAAHVAWARGGAPRDAKYSLMGLVFELHGGSAATWTFDPGAAIARRVTPLASRVEVETCARCHSRRAQVWGDYVYGGPIADTHRLSLLEPGLYAADGQIEDEVYEYGSFLQSRMYVRGVTCTDCHDAHGAKVKLPGNALCGQCHSPTKYDARSHHFHEPGTKAASCVECHMGGRYYMVVDERRDHSFRIPRPDLSVALSIPNACNRCHRDKSARWAADAVARWYGPEAARRPQYAEAIEAGRRGRGDAVPMLSGLAADPETPAIVRATALSLLGRYAGAVAPPLVEHALADADPLVRRAAVSLLSALDPEARSRLAPPLLSDPIRTVRLEAVPVVASVPPALSTPEERRSLDRELEEYRASQRLNADRAESWLNLGVLDAGLGRVEEAEAEYRQAIRRQPTFGPAYVNLCELLRQRGREDEAEKTLRDGLRLSPSDASLHHALGLALARRQRVGDALPELRRAAELRPDEARYAYVYGVALHDSGDARLAIQVLAETAKRHPEDRDILAALVGYSREAGDARAALQYARRLARILPNDTTVRLTVQELERLAGR